MTRARSTVLALVSLTLAACASSVKRYVPSTVSDRDTLTSVELASVAGTTQNTYSAVERLRPMFLATRPGSAMLRGAPPRIHVFINGHLAGDVDVLRTMPVASVESIRRIQATEAYTRYGEIHAGDGVLMIRVR